MATLLLAGACSSDDKSTDDLEALRTQAQDLADQATDDATAGTGSPAGVDDSPDQAATDTGGGDAASDDGTGGGMPGIGDLGDCFDFSMAVTAVFGNIGAAMGNPDVAEESVSILDDAAGNVPDELADDWAIFSQALADWFDTLGTTPLAELGSVDDPFEDPAVQQASDNIQAWLDENCGG